MPFCELRYFSNVLGMQTAANVILPSLEQPKPYAVMFLLHGLSDDHTMWSRRTSIERYVENLPLMVVMPNGGRGFYTDADQGFAYGKAIGEELPQVVRNYFPVTDHGWAITGLSMGGYGAFRLALRYSDLFRSAVSHSGALHFGHYPNEGDDDWSREMSRIVGPQPAGSDHDLFHLAASCANLPALRFDCGVDDFLIDSNREYHRYLEAQAIAHEYEEFPGDHNWAYWDEHVQQAIQFHHAKLGF